MTEFQFATVAKPVDATPFVEEYADETPLSDNQCEQAGCTNEKREGSGRGRKPRYCEQHSSQSSRNGGTGRAVKDTSNDRLANDAAAALVFVNNVAATIGAGFGFKGTSDAVKVSNEEFRANIYEALKHNPALCKRILSFGGKAGTASILAAYSMLAFSVAPVAVIEYQMKKAEKENNE